MHEYFDINRNNKYELHRVVFERDGDKEVYGVSWYGDKELSRKEIENLPLIGDERRFITP